MMKLANCQNQRFDGLKDYMDYKSTQSKNLCHLRNQNTSVIQTTAEIINSISELI
jgi:hypothetical protein